MGTNHRARTFRHGAVESPVGLFAYRHSEDETTARALLQHSTDGAGLSAATTEGSVLATGVERSEKSVRTPTTDADCSAHFARVRLLDELVSVATAHPDPAAQAAYGGIAMELYAAYQRRKELAASREIIRKLVLIQEAKISAVPAEQQDAPA